MIARPSLAMVMYSDGDNGIWAMVAVIYGNDDNDAQVMAAVAAMLDTCSYNIDNILPNFSVHLACTLV